jgi:hypothetical protein
MKRLWNAVFLKVAKILAGKGPPWWFQLLPLEDHISHCPFEYSLDLLNCCNFYVKFQGVLLLYQRTIPSHFWILKRYRLGQHFPHNILEGLNVSPACSVLTTSTAMGNCELYKSLWLLLGYGARWILSWQRWSTVAYNYKLGSVFLRLWTPEGAQRRGQDLWVSSWVLGAS